MPEISVSITITIKREEKEECFGRLSNVNFDGTWKVTYLCGYQAEESFRGLILLL